MKVKFSKVFKKRDNRFILNKSLKIGGTVIKISKGDYFSFEKNGFVMSGINWSLFENYDFEVKENKEMFEILGCYRN